MARPPPDAAKQGMSVVWHPLTGANLLREGSTRLE